MLGSLNTVVSEKIEISVGIDDTDSPKGMCTTYVMYRLIEKANTEGFKLVGMPRLVRLNPACPFKTRGNAALGADFILDYDKINKFKEILVDLIFDLAEINEKKTNPAFVIINKNDIDTNLVEFSRIAVKRIVNLNEALNLLKSKAIFAFGYNGPRGLIGALSAAAYDFPSGFTYELIAYRIKEMRGKKRLVDEMSVYEADIKTKGCTFDNVDQENKEIKITPHTPCPVLLGIRGLDPECVKKAFSIIKINEPIEGYIIYKTNQATDDHIIEVNSIKEIEPLTSVSIKGKVASMPALIKGGHVFVEITDGTDKIRIAAYEPTKNFRKVLINLRPGDFIQVWGSYKPKDNEPPTINLEKIRIISIAPYVKLLNPLCPICGTRMKSEGKGKGYQCPKCKYKTNSAEKVQELEKRNLVPGFYDVPARARRHLSKPSFLEVLKDERQS